VNPDRRALPLERRFAPQSADMFEYHGWVTILDTTGAVDVDEDPVPGTLDAVRAAIGETGMLTWAALEPRNGLWFLTINGFHNHRNPNVVALFERIAQIAPGSYGLLYTHDDEANLWTSRPPHPDEAGESPSHWYSRVMKRGRVERHLDVRLSPHVGTVEDEWSG
jgi:Immunity protein 7